MAAEPEDYSGLTDDPVAQLLLSGRAETLREAEELYLDSCLPEVVQLLQGLLSDEELGRHPLMWMLRAREPALGGSGRVTPEERLAWIVSALGPVGLSCLVMGGHAVRYYGLQRYTNDFDLVLAPDGWDDLADRLAQAGLSAGGTPVEGNSWRPKAFRRFQIGTLPDGQEEWLEFWRENHLLSPFPDLFARREVGAYGGREVPFLALPDLIRSKETERAKDWDDISYLEELLDARLHARYVAGAISLADALVGLRSRRGFDTYLSEASFNDHEAVQAALGQTVIPITQAFLLPHAPQAATRPPLVAMEPLIERKLRSVAPASSLHRSLVEVVRRQYKVFCQARDRADKEAIRATQQPGPP